jgi:predicted alpha/beta hydrolase family esterase
LDFMRRGTRKERASVTDSGDRVIDERRVPVLILPGLGNSGPGHWQSWLEGRLPEAHRVEQRDWAHPDRMSWTAALERSIGAQEPPVVLVGHSLGAMTIVHWASPADRRVAGALLVAPTDPESATASEASRTFSPVPMRRLPFASIVVASSDDSRVSVERSREFARAWGSRCVELPEAGHINDAAGFGPWPLAEELVAELAAAAAKSAARG